MRWRRRRHLDLTPLGLRARNHMWTVRLGFFIGALVGFVLLAWLAR
jgi:hypothetical protein